MFGGNAPIATPRSAARNVRGSRDSSPPHLALPRVVDRRIAWSFREGNGTSQRRRPPRREGSGAGLPPWIVRCRASATALRPGAPGSRGVPVTGGLGRAVGGAVGGRAPARRRAPTRLV